MEFIFKLDIGFKLNWSSFQVACANSEEWQGPQVKHVLCHSLLKDKLSWLDTDTMDGS